MRTLPPDERKKPHVISLTDAEYQQLQQVAKAAGYKTASQYIAALLKEKRDAFRLKWD